MLAIGRVPNTDGMGLEKAGVQLGKRGARRSRRIIRATSVDHIYAIGDVTDRLALTPVAIHEAMCFREDRVRKQADAGRSRRCVPTAVFTSRKSARSA